jgi:hypothetical protein
VSLSWQAPASGGAPTSYRLLAGHTPGASTYQVAVSATSVSGPGVPAGTYFVRVVAVNSAGVSAASNEVTLAVDEQPHSSASAAVHKIPTVKKFLRARVSQLSGSGWPQGMARRCSSAAQTTVL